MDFLVFGASGRTGSAFVRQALAAGHGVSALVRDAKTKLPDGVITSIGDVLNPEHVTAAVRREHTIVITLGGLDSLTAGCANIIRAASAVGAQRLLGVVGAGVLQADETHQRHEMPDYPPRFRPVGAAHQAFYAAASASPLNWTLVCAPNIVDRPRTNAYHTLANYFPEGTGAIATEDLAAFLLEEALTPRYLRSRVGMNGA
jgi:putative NADH-flavin reductase